LGDDLVVWCRDLAKNWDIDIATALEDYLEGQSTRHIHTHIGITPAGLVVPRQ
jgi:hypothetical protein